MSTYISDVKNPKTGKLQSATFIDNYYDHRRYAVAFRKDGEDSNIQDEISADTHDIYPVEEIEEKQ